MANGINSSPLPGYVRFFHPEKRAAQSKVVKMIAHVGTDVGTLKESRHTGTEG